MFDVERKVHLVPMDPRAQKQAERRAGRLARVLGTRAEDLLRTVPLERLVEATPGDQHRVSRFKDARVDAHDPKDRMRTAPISPSEALRAAQEGRRKSNPGPR